MIRVEDLLGCGHGSRAVQNLGVSRDPGSLVTQTVSRINRQYMPCFHFRVRLITQCPFSPGKPAFRKSGNLRHKGQPGLARWGYACVINAEICTGSGPQRERHQEERQCLDSKNLRHPPEGMSSKDLAQARWWFVHLRHSSISTAVAPQRGRRLSESGKAPVGKVPSFPTHDCEQGPTTVP